MRSYYQLKQGEILHPLLVALEFFILLVGELPILFSIMINNELQSLELQVLFLLANILLSDEPILIPPTIIFVLE